jgi:hypothetical protein
VSGESRRCSGAGGVDRIVTVNLRDLPADLLAEH